MGTHNKVDINAQGPQKEGLAAAGITPGHLLERTTTAKTVQVHSTSMGNVTPKIFALEDDLQGNDIDDAYSAADPVKLIIAYPGDEILARYPTGIGYTPAINDRMVSNGNGELRPYQTMEDSSGLGETNPSECIVGVILEVISSGKIRIEVI